MNAERVHRGGRRSSSATQGRRSSATLDWLNHEILSLPSTTLSSSNALAPLPQVARLVAPQSLVGHSSPSCQPKGAVFDEESTTDIIEHLQRTVTALQVDLAERDWACKRATELGAALDVLTEQNIALTKERDALKGRVSELETLRQAQQVLIAVIDEGGIDPKRLQSLLTSSEDFRESCHEIQSACRSIAKWGPTVCPACLSAKEEKLRAELQLKERSSWQTIMTAWDALFAAQRYCTVQYSEVETERMWEEDMRSHRVSMLRLQQELSAAEQKVVSLALLNSEVAYWKKAYQNLEQQTSASLERSRTAHRDDLHKVRQEVLSAHPDQVMLKYLLLTNLKMHHGHGKLLFWLAIVRKHLWVLKREAASLIELFTQQLNVVQQFALDSVRRLGPQDWTPVPLEHDGGATSASQRTKTPMRRAQPPVLSSYARNAIIIGKGGTTASKPTSTDK